MKLTENQEKLRIAIFNEANKLQVHDKEFGEVLKFVLDCHNLVVKEENKIKLN